MEDVHVAEDFRQNFDQRPKFPFLPDESETTLAAQLPMKDGGRLINMKCVRDSLIAIRTMYL
jgi:hypothetical protein